ncbi:MAG: Coq4 family protein [Halioglobus sp.]
MSANEYAYSPISTKNPFRYALALWRFMRSKTDDDIISEVAIIEIGFARSRFGRRLARWEETIDLLKKNPELANTLHEKNVSGPIIVEELEGLEYGTVGQVFAEHCRNRGINPNLINIPLEEESDWLLNHLFQSHDIWHVVTGWANDEVGEVGLAGFYCGQLRSPPFFIFLFALIMLKKVLRKDEQIDQYISAFCTGYRSGCSAQCLFGIDWTQHWAVPLKEMRRSLGVDSSEAGEYGEGILAQAA